MIPSRFLEIMKSKIKRLQTFTDRAWYLPFLGFLSAIDSFIIIIPNDGLLISNSMLTPKRWFFLALSFAIGSTLGALGLAALVELQGLSWILKLYPGVNQTEIWKLSETFFVEHGLLLIFVVALTPIFQQPTIILAGLANTSLIQFAAVTFLGRLIKCLIMAYAGSHAPRLLKKMFGVRSELEEVGIKLE